jgi:hypothetical protein
VLKYSVKSPREVLVDSTWKVSVERAFTSRLLGPLEKLTEPAPPVIVNFRYPIPPCLRIDSEEGATVTTQGTGVGLVSGVGDALGVGLALGLGEGFGLGLGSGVGEAFGVGLGLGVGDAAGDGLGLGEGDG